MDFDDSMDSAMGLLGTALVAGIALQGTKMMTDMVRDVSRPSENRVQQSRPKDDMNDEELGWYSPKPMSRQSQPVQQPKPMPVEKKQPFTMGWPTPNYYNIKPKGSFFSPSL
jgi:hypothetical protein